MSQSASRSQAERGSGGGGGDGLQMQLHGRLNSIRSDIHGIKDVIDQAVRACTVTALDLEEAGESETVDEVEQSLRMLLDSQRRLEAEEKLLAKLSSRSDLAKPEAEYGKWWEEEEEKLKNMGDAAKYGSNEKYRDFRQQVWEVTHEGEAMPALFGDANQEGSDEELVISGARLTYKCPITTTWLNDPVSSKTCKHSFSRDAITDYLRAQRGECACPVGGCSRRIRAQDLYADRVLERKVARHLRQLEAEESAATYTVVR